MLSACANVLDPSNRVEHRHNNLGIGRGVVIVISSSNRNGTLSIFRVLLYFYKQKPMEAFRSSWEHTKEYQWQIMLGQLVILILTAIPVWLVRTLISELDAGNSLVTFLIAVASSILAIPITIFGFRVFTLHQEKLNEQSSGGYKKVAV